jgi:hypothetical protein
VGVGDELPADGIGESSFQAAQGLHWRLGFGELAAVVGPAFGVVADLHDGGDVQQVVQSPVPGAGQPVSDLVSAGGVQGAVPVQDAKWLRSGNRATSPTSARIPAAPAGPTP